MTSLNALIASQVRTKSRGGGGDVEEDSPPTNKWTRRLRRDVFPSPADSRVVEQQQDEEEKQTPPTSPTEMARKLVLQEARMQGLEAENKRLLAFLTSTSSSSSPMANDGSKESLLKQELMHVRASMSAQLEEAMSQIKIKDNELRELRLELKARTVMAGHRSGGGTPSNTVHMQQQTAVREYYQRKIAELGRKYEARIRAAARGDMEVSKVAATYELEVLRAENEALRCRVEEFQDGDGGKETGRIAMELQTLRRSAVANQKYRNALAQQEREVKRLTQDNATLTAALEQARISQPPSQSSSRHGLPSLKEHQALLNKIKILQERLDVREKRLARMMGGHEEILESALEEERNKFRAIIDAKNADLYRFKLELDAIVKGLRGMGIFN